MLLLERAAAASGNFELTASNQTLRTTIDWSYDLLEAGEWALLRRLCRPPRRLPG